MDKNHAPGLSVRPNKTTQPSYYWVAKRAAASASDYALKTVRLHGTEDEIAHRCRVLTSELREWLSKNGIGEQPAFNGTISGLIDVYRLTPESPYHEVKHSTRRMYDESLDLLNETVGARRLEKLTGLDFIRWYGQLKEPASEGEPERMRRAYKAMQLLRIIVKFGITANVKECFRLGTALENTRFASPPARTKAVVFDQMTSFCDLAVEEGRLKLAIAQALQFELTLRQIDVIGEWEPNDGKSGGIVYHGQKWSGGALWSHIDADWIFTKQTTKTGQMAEHDIKAYPYLHGLLARVPASERVGPIVVDLDGMPYQRGQYAKLWRRIARKVGIPADVWNRDSRAGGVTEGSDAGADIEHLRHHANHADIKTTGRYNRKTLEKTRSVANLRVAHRAE